MGDVVPHRLEMRVAQEMGDIVLPPGEIIVDAEYVVASGEQAFAQMRSEKPGPAGDEDTLGYHAGHGTTFD